MKLFMKIILFITLIFMSNLCANNYSNKTTFDISYYNDKNDNIEFKDIDTLKFNTISTNKHSLPIDHHTVWYKVKIINNSNITKEVFLHNNFAYYSKNITIYEYKKNQTKKINYNLLDKNVGKLLDGKIIIYPIFLNPNSQKTIYIKNQSLTHQIIDINILNKKDSNKSLINNSFYPNIIVIILFTLSIYNSILFFFTKRKEFIFYALYMINCSFGLFYMYGSVFSNFGLYGEISYLFNVTAILLIPFLMLFIKTVFDIGKNNKLNMIINSVILLSLLFILSTIFLDLYIVIQNIQFLFIYSYIIIFYIGFFLYKHNHPLSKLFLFSYIVYIMGMTVTLLSLIGLIEFKLLYFYGSGIALVIEGFIFSYILGYRLKLLEDKIKDNIDKNRQKDKILFQQSKLASMGEMLGNIAHQWRQPINRINLSLEVVNSCLKDDNIDKEFIKKKITISQKNIDYMSQTIEDFTNFFMPNKDIQQCNITNTIDKAIKLLDTKLLNIKLNIISNKQVIFSTYENELLQVLLIILNNAIDNFELNKIENPKINIDIKEENKYLILKISDNGLGIKKENIDKVFEPYFTTKFKSEGTGLGLYMAKMLVEESMKGKINILSDEIGVEFKIILPME